MTNSDNGGVLNQEILQTLAAMYDWPALKPETRVVAEVDPGLFEELAGEYEIPGEVVVTLEVVDGELWADVPGQGLQELLPESNFLFFSRADGTEVIFIRENGRVVAISVEGMRAERRR